MSTIINATTTNGVVIQPDNSGSLVLQTNNGTTALTISTAQNVGIGTSSPSGKFHVANTGTAGTTADNLAVYFSSTNRNSNVYIQAKNTEGSYLNFGDVDNASIGRIGYEHSSDYMKFDTNATERMRIDSSGNLLFNSGYGSVATAYGCRAWVNFNGTGTPAIRASGNVSSITDIGTGEYTVNFTTAMPDINYSAVGSCGSGTGGNDEFVLTTNYNVAPTTSATRIGSHRANSGAATDLAWISVAIFR
jgi:hypothetical protein